MSLRHDRGRRGARTTRIVTPAGHAAAPWTHALSLLPAHEPGDQLQLGSGDLLVVAVPHPDDESLAVGGVLQRLHGCGVDIVVVLASAGEAAYGDSGEQANALGRIRMREFRRALGALRLDAVEVRELQLPDGHLGDHILTIGQALTDVLGAHSPPAPRRVAVLAPWTEDPHPDHRAVGRAAGVAARRAGALCWYYPVWMRHGLGPDDPAIPWPDVRRVALRPAELANKHEAIARYASQLLGPSAQVGPVLPPSVVEHFTDGDELLIRPAPGDRAVGEHFDALYEGNADPWQVGTSWYERRKRAVLLASLPRARYHCGWEPGCSLGHLSAELGRRCDRLIASDISSRAIAAARARVAEEHVSFAVAQTPAQPPDLDPGSCDLVVLSEFLYYLPEQARAATIALAADLLRPGGQLVVAHWRGHPADAHCSGEQANAEAAAALGSGLVHHVDQDFILDVAEKVAGRPPERADDDFAGPAPESNDRQP